MPAPLPLSTHGSHAESSAGSSCEDRRPILQCAYCYQSITPDEPCATFTPDIAGRIVDLHFHHVPHRDCWNTYRALVLPPRTEWREP